MKSLEKWQFISFVSRGVAMGFGIVQSFVILRILSVSEWGLVQLVVSVGAALGIYQHLGLASASNREIAASDKKTDIFKVFFTTAAIRYTITIPLAIGFFLLAPKITKTYGYPEILLPLRLYAVVIFLQGGQAILNAVISGTKRFKALFIFQGAIALVSVIIYIPLVYIYKIQGFFYAMVAHEAIKSLSLTAIAFKPLQGKMKIPTKNEFKSIFKSIFSLGMSIYLVKIIITNWEKLGANLLGLLDNPQLIGVYAFALLYAKKLMNVSDAVTDVNLPVFSEEFVKDIKGFKKLFANNFNRIYMVVLVSAATALFWSKELINLLIGSDKYNDAIPLLIPMVFAFIFFSLLDVIKSSVAIPAKLVKEMITGYFLMFLFTLSVYLSLSHFVSPIVVMTYAMLIGAAVSFFYLVYVLQKKLNFCFFTHEHFLLLVQAFVISYSISVPLFLWKFATYIVYMLLFVWSLLIVKFVTKADFHLLLKKLKQFAIKS